VFGVPSGKEECLEIVGPEIILNSSYFVHKYKGKWNICVSFLSLKRIKNNFSKKISLGY